METSDNKNPKTPGQVPEQGQEPEKKEPIVVEKSLFRGPLAWMAQNSVAANLLFFMFLVAGLVMLPSLLQSP